MLLNLSFKKQFYLSFIGIVALTMMFEFVFSSLSSYKQKKESFEVDAKLQARLIADSVLAPLMFLDKDGVQENLNVLKKYESINKAFVYDTKNKLFAGYTKAGIDGANSQHLSDDWFIDDGKLLLLDSSFVLKEPIELNGVTYGFLYLEKSTKELNQFIIDSFLQMSIFSFILFMIMGLFIHSLANKLINPILNLSRKLYDLSLTNDYSVRLKYESKNEIAQLYNSFNTLFDSIQAHQLSRDEALSQAKSYHEHLEKLTNELEERVALRTSELQSSLDTLKNTQNQLIQSEKMASLGALVSGVAHEVNTPLGNAVTGSTIIKKEAQILNQALKDGSLKKSTLESSLECIDQTAKLLYSSVNHAADLIRSFKRISVDQSIEDKREFDLVEYVDEIFLTFHNKLKHIPVEVEVISPKKFIITSYPGVFAQILSNFIQNSIMHGFETKTGNEKITLQLTELQDSFEFIYSDNGIGMDDKMRLKAFDPFITTKRNAGGTGLGLNIVYNLVSQKLKGSISLETSIGKGVKFTITIPKT